MHLVRLSPFLPPVGSFVGKGSKVARVGAVVLIR